MSLIVGHSRLVLFLLPCSLFGDSLGISSFLGFSALVFSLFLQAPLFFHLLAVLLLLFSLGLCFSAGFFISSESGSFLGLFLSLFLFSLPLFFLELSEQSLLLFSLLLLKLSFLGSKLLWRLLRLSWLRFGLLLNGFSLLLVTWFTFLPFLSFVLFRLEDRSGSWRVGLWLLWRQEKLTTEQVVSQLLLLSSHFL